MFRFGMAADLSTFVFAVLLTMILYALLKPANRNAALVMPGFTLVQDAIGGLNGVLMAIAGACYLANSAAVILSPGSLRCCFRQSSCRHSSANYRLQ